METVRIAGPLVVQGLPGGDEGDRVIVVAPNPHTRVEIPLGKELCEIIAARMSMPDEQLANLEEGEEREQRLQQLGQQLGPNGSGPGLPT